MLTTDQPQPQTKYNLLPEPFRLPYPGLQDPRKHDPRPSHPRTKPGAVPSCWGGGQRPFRAAQGPASSEVAAKAAVLKQPQREGWWAGGGIWGTAIMWLASDSCTASPITSSCSPLDSPSAQELRGEMVPLTGHGERRKGKGVPGQTVGYRGCCHIAL